jgi:hypothetical protein
MIRLSRQVGITEVVVEGSFSSELDRGQTQWVFVESLIDELDFVCNIIETHKEAK